MADPQADVDELFSDFGGEDDEDSLPTKSIDSEIAEMFSDYASETEDQETINPDDYEEMSLGEFAYGMATEGVGSLWNAASGAAEGAVDYFQNNTLADAWGDAASGLYEAGKAGINAAIEDPAGAVDFAGDTASTVGAGVAGFMGSGGPANPFSPFIGIAAGAGGKLTWKTFSDLVGLSGDEEERWREEQGLPDRGVFDKSLEQRVFETGAEMMPDLIMASVGRLAKLRNPDGGRVNRAIREGADISKSRRSRLENLARVITEDVKVSQDELNQAVEHVGERLIESTNDHFRKLGHRFDRTKIRSQMLDVVAGPKNPAAANSRLGGGLLDTVAGEVNSFIKSSSATFDLKKVESLISRSVDRIPTVTYDAMGQAKPGKGFTVYQNVKAPYVKALARKANVSPDEVMGLPMKKQELAARVGALERIPKNQPRRAATMARQVESLSRDIKDLTEKISGVELSAEEAFDITRSLTKQDFTDLEDPVKGSLALLRLNFKNEVIEGLDPSLRSGFDKANKQYWGLANIRDYLEDSARIESVDMLADQNLIREAVQTVKRETYAYSAPTRPTPYQSWAAINDYPKGQAPSPAALRRIAVAMSEATTITRASVSEFFTPHNSLVLGQMLKGVEEAALIESQSPGADHVGSFLESLLLVKEAQAEGVGADETTQRALLSQLLSDPSTAAIIQGESPEVDTRHLSGVKHFGGEVLDRQKYLDNLRKDRELSFRERSKLEREFVQSGGRIPARAEPSVEITPELKTQLDQAKSRNEAIEKLSVLSNSKKVVSMSSMKELIKEAELRERGEAQDGAEEDPFEESLSFTLGEEGGINDDPRDSGNAGGNVTNMGVTQSAYNSFRRSQGLPERSTREMDQDEARALYQQDYWSKPRINELPFPLSLVVFDEAVNAGPRVAIKHLQKALGVSVDGKIGPETIEAVEGARMQTLIEDVLAMRESRYRRLLKVGKNSAFKGGWLNRVKNLRKFALGRLERDGDTQVA